MRITGGRARGIRLQAPGGNRTRPATDRLREALFSSLGPIQPTTQVADLFAGTGAYGLEALSRGAVSASFFETSREALSCLRKNIEAVVRSCKLDSGAAQVLALDAYQASPPVGGAFNLLFADPPYGLREDDLKQLFDAAMRLTTLDARFILELPGDQEAETEDWIPIRRIGKAGRDRPSAIIFSKAQAS